MAEYLVSGVTPGGRKVTEWIDADSADLAVKTLRDQGYEHIVLHTDDLAARYINGGKNHRESSINPREWADLKHLGQLGWFFFLLRKLYMQACNWLWCLALPLAVLFYRRYLDCPWDITDVLILVLLASPWLVAANLLLFGASRRYQRVLEAWSWAQWDEVLRLLPTSRPHMPVFEGALLEAKAMAGLGRVSEALEAIASFAHDETVPEWRYWSGVAEIFSAAHKPEESLAATEKAFAAAPDDPVVSADLALALVKRRRELDRAEQLLRNARSHALSELLDALVQRVEGKLALERGKLDEAQGLLEQSLRKLQAVKRNALMRGGADMIHADLAICRAQMGDRAEALKHFAQAERRLRAHQEDEQLERCQQALGITS